MQNIPKFREYRFVGWRVYPFVRKSRNLPIPYLKTSPLSLKCESQENDRIVTTGKKLKKFGNLLTDGQINLFLKTNFQGCRTGFTPYSSASAKSLRSPRMWLEVQLLFCFKCIQPTITNLYILPLYCDLYGSHGKSSNGLKPSTSPDTLRFVLLPVPCITLQSRSHSIHTIVGRDNDVINFLSNKFSGVV
jgi:hypothetical protein